MNSSKYSNLLTVILVILIIMIIAIIGLLGVRFYKSSKLNKESKDYVGSYEENIDQTDEDKPDEEPVTDDGEPLFSSREDGETGSSSDSSTKKKVKKFKGYTITGTIEIPATGLKSPIIAHEEYSKSALETAIVELYGSGLNKVGNTTLVGHNYRNGTFFSNNKKLKEGDKIYITDSEGKKLSYTIYKKYEGSDTESEYMTRDTKGAIEISLSTCTDDSKARLIIWAKADS